MSSTMFYIVIEPNQTQKAMELLLSIGLEESAIATTASGNARVISRMFLAKGDKGDISAGFLKNNKILAEDLKQAFSANSQEEKDNIETKLSSIIRKPALKITAGNNNPAAEKLTEVFINDFKAILITEDMIVKFPGEDAIKPLVSYSQNSDTAHQKKPSESKQPFFELRRKYDIQKNLPACKWASLQSNK